jgi:hypothetical protein
MEHTPDPQISAAVIQTHGAIAAALLGAFASIWAFINKRRNQDMQCLRACENMVSVAEILVVVIRMAGFNHPALLHEVDKAQDKINETKAWLNQESLK